MVGYTRRIAYHERILACGRADLSAFVPWSIGTRPVGFVHRDRVRRLLDLCPAFGGDTRRLYLAANAPAATTRVLGDLVACLHRSGELRAPMGEAYPVLDRANLEPLATIDRVAVPWFGSIARGVHLNGYVRTPAGPELWIARRAAGKRTFAGHLDNTVAGGQAAGHDAWQTLLKECAEEAGLSAELCRRAQPVGTIGYVHQDGASLKVDRLVCFDLELPADVTPHPVDGEVEAFERWSCGAVAESLRGDGPWKPNCALVALDFLLRWGRLDDELPADERHRLWRALHRG